MKKVFAISQSVPKPVQTIKSQSEISLTRLFFFCQDKCQGQNKTTEAFYFKMLFRVREYHIENAENLFEIANIIPG